MKTLLFISLIILSNSIFAQTSIITGTVKDSKQTPLPGVTVIIEGSEPLIGTVTDNEGNYKLSTIPGSFTLKASYLGFIDLRKFNVVLVSGNLSIVNFELQEQENVLNEVVVRVGRSSSIATIETPLSIQSLSSEEISSNPGGNFDISRVVQSLPGVSTSIGGVRNDIIIRGGAPNENVYYLDGIEVPIINHFTTQGSSGGPQGILNVSFLEDVTLSTSAFQAKYDNALSSVFSFSQRDGNKERIQSNLRLSGTEFATTFDGPISNKTTFLASARRSYLQLFFELIDLPIRPNYWDFQYKITHKFNKKTSLTALGIGAIDEFNFAIPKSTTPEKEFVLRSSPFINQDSYTTGLSLNHLIKDGFLNFSLSRNFFNNRLDKFEDGENNNESLRTLKSRSNEIENKLRFDVNKYIGGWKLSTGLSIQYAQYDSEFFNVIRKEIRKENGDLVQPGVSFDFDTDINFFKYGAFVQASRSFFNNRLSISSGLRTDLNSFTSNGLNILNTLSPRTSISYLVNNKFKINTSVGRYFKIPVYTVLGFRDDEGSFLNRDNKYIQSDHLVGGIELLPSDDLRFTIESFYKNYRNYPISNLRGVSLANDGAEFSAVGNEDVSSIGKGKTYGVEAFIQKKLTKNTFYSLSYTWFRSRFSSLNGEFISSSWDTQNLISALLGKKFKSGWELGLKFRYSGGAPFTPLDLESSQINYLSLGTGVRDINRLNSERLDSFNQLDLRIDKKWNYKRFSFDLFLDIQNLFLTPTPNLTEYTFERNDDLSYKTIDGQPVKQDGSNAIPLLLENNDAFFVPTIGFVIQF